MSLGGALGNGLTTSDTTAYNAFTFSAWYLAAGHGHGDYERIIDKNYATGACICRLGTTPNCWAAYFQDLAISSPLTINQLDGSWHFIALSREANLLSLIGDGGIQAATATRTALPCDASPVFLGRTGPYYNYNDLWGYLDESRTASAAIPSAAIALSYAAVTAPLATVSPSAPPISISLAAP